MSPKKKNKRKPAPAKGISREVETQRTQKQDAVKLIAILIILGLVMTLFVGALLASPAKAAESASPTSPATGQIYDTDRDGQENNIDPDIDGDGIVNGNDTDIDGDGIANNQDGDPAATLGRSDGPPPVQLDAPTVLDKALPAQIRYPLAVIVVVAGAIWLVIRRRNKSHH